MIIHTINKDFDVRYSLEKIEKDLNLDKFVRCHKSFLVNLTYVENRGAAFGMLQNNQTIFIVVAAIASCYGIYYLHTKKMNNIGKIGIILVISGAIGNLIDRVRLGFVVDYLDFHIIWNYVFNLADCFVVVGTILLCIYIITSEEDKKQVK